MLDTLSKQVATYILVIWLFGPLASHGAEMRVSRETVFIKNGNVFISFNGKTSQLTNSGLDFEPVLSPDGQWVAFSRLVPEIIKLCEKDEEEYFCAKDQIWIFDLAKKSERLLVAPVKEPPDKEMAIFTQKTFSPNSKILFFKSNPWSLNRQIHAIDVDGKNERLVTYGGGFSIIKSVGDREMQYLVGSLVVGRHDYFMIGGSYDWRWIVTPEGKTLGPIGPSSDDFTFSLNVEYMEN
jgi:hypothetical protein